MWLEPLDRRVFVAIARGVAVAVADARSRCRCRADSCTMPNGATAPGKVWPSPPVPMNGSTSGRPGDERARRGRAGRRGSGGSSSATLPRSSRACRSAVLRQARHERMRDAAMTVRALFPTSFYEGDLADAALVAELADACPTSPPRIARASAGRRSTAIAATPPMRRSTTCRSAIRASPISQRALDRHVAAFAKECGFDLAEQAEARQPVGQRPEARRHAFGAYPSAQRRVGHDLRRGAAGLGRAEARGPAAADDDGRARPAPDTFVYAEPAEPAVCSCGKAGCATR